MRLPPPELRDELHAAARRPDELREQGRELHFALDVGGTRVSVEVRDLAGRVLGIVTPAEALEVACGAALQTHGTPPARERG
jgi:hypothetical protein